MIIWHHLITKNFHYCSFFLFCISLLLFFQRIIMKQYLYYFLSYSTPQ
eukprot:UN00211